MRNGLALRGLGPLLLAAAAGCSHPAPAPKTTAAGPTPTAASRPDPMALDLLSLMKSCEPLSKGKFKTDHEPNAPETPICALPGAAFWKADMDVDCDGRPSPECNGNTDPWFQAETTGRDSRGEYLTASVTPYVVVPSAGTLFDYKQAGIELGNVVGVVYNGKLVWGVFADEGPSDIIGEASYALAKSLGIDPDPANGGTSETVHYLVCTGPEYRVKALENHDEAVSLGERCAAKLLASSKPQPK